jgi:hypothetical protein
MVQDSYWLWWRTLENIFEIVIVVFVEPTKLLRFLGTLQLSFDVTVLRAVVRLEPKTAVGPDLPLGPKTVWRLH